MSEREQPDPGEGWRMLYDGEITQAGDQYKREEDEWIDDPNPTKVFNSKIHWPHRRRVFMSDTLRDLSEPQPDLVNAPTHHGGDHYQSLAIQPWDYATANRMEYNEGVVVAYVTRWRSKGGLQDLQKAIDHINKIIEYATKKE
jgi:hypothetical protein